MRERPGGAAGEREERERERRGRRERKRRERREDDASSKTFFFPLWEDKACARLSSSNGEIRRNRSCLSLSPPHTGPLGALPGGRARARHPLPAVAARGREEREKERKEKGRERPGSRRLWGRGGKNSLPPRKKNRHQIPPPTGIDLVVAGFPGVDVSRAGLRAGLDGRASGLVRVVFETPFSSRFFFSLLVAG